MPKTYVFENRIAEYLRVFEKRKHRKHRFAGQKTIIEYAPYTLGLSLSFFSSQWIV